MTDARSVLLRVEDLQVRFFTDEGIVNAIDGVDLEVERGKTLSIVGESGCGKSVTARAIMNIVSSPGRITGGRVVLPRRIDSNGRSDMYEEIVLTDLDPNDRKIQSIRGKDIAMVFQEPMSSFSPVHTIGWQITEAILLHQKISKQEARQQAIEILKLVGMPAVETNIDRYPHQLSGGMCQRAMIGMALSCRPSLLIADEPTTALDVTTEAQILDLLRDLQKQMDMAIMYITHNLGVVAQLADEVAVMYLGRIVERAPVDELFYNPKHPYTRALLRSIPRIGHRSLGRLESIPGTVPDPFLIPAGCSFHPRCRSFMEGICNTTRPRLIDLGDGHKVSCHLYAEERAA